MSPRPMPWRRSAAAGCASVMLLLALLAPAAAKAEEAVKAPLSAESLLLDGAAAGARLVVWASAAIS